ncbi:DUF4194 domain-containing protein [Microbacterium lacusdiani]
MTGMDAHEDPAEHLESDGLWHGDLGRLHERSRRALLEVLKGPYLSGRQQPQLWAALVADERAIRSRLHELFLELVIDPVDEFAFVRKVRTDEIDVPSALRSEALTFIDTAMLLVLRQIQLSAMGDRRVIAGRDEVYDRLAVYRAGADEGTFERNLNAAWTRMKSRFRVIHDVGDDRVEISPVVRYLIDEERVRALAVVYGDIASGAGAGGRDDVEEKA